METINRIELCDPAVYPSDDVLRTILGRSYGAYAALLDMFHANDMVYEWRYYTDGNVWLCKVQHKKRTIVWMSAWKGYVQATVYFPIRYMHDIYGLNIREDTADRIKRTKNTGTSKPCIFEIKTKAALKDFSTVMQCKMVVK